MDTNLEKNMTEFSNYLSCNGNGGRTPYFDTEDIEDMFHKYLERNESDTAGKLLDLGELTHPTDEVMRDLRVEWHLSRHEVTEALRIMQTYENPDDHLLLSYYVSAYAQSGKEKLARTYAEKLCCQPDFSPEYDYFDIGVSFYEAEMYKDALHYFRLAEKYDNSTDLLLNIAYSYTFLDDFKNAREYADKCIVNDPFNGEVWELKAWTCLESDDPAEAEKATQYAIAINERNKTAWSYRLNAQLLQNKQAEADLTARELILKCGETADNYAILGCTLAGHGFFKKALEYFGKTDEQTLFNTYVLPQYCETLKECDKNMELIELLSPHEDLLSTDEFLTTLLAEAYVATKQTDKAIQLCKSNSHLMLVKVELVDIYINSSQTDKALETAKELLQDNPSAQLYVVAANAAWHNNDTELCNTYLKKAKSLDPEYNYIVRMVNEEMEKTLISKNQ